MKPSQELRSEEPKFGIKNSAAPMDFSGWYKAFQCLGRALMDDYVQHLIVICIVQTTMIIERENEIFW